MISLILPCYLIVSIHLPNNLFSISTAPQPWNTWVFPEPNPNPLPLPLPPPTQGLDNLQAPGDNHPVKNTI